MRGNLIRKKDLIDSVYNRLGRALNRYVIADCVDEILKILYEELKNERVVPIKNFGTFYTTLIRSPNNVKKLIKVVKFTSHEELRKKFKRRKLLEKRVKSPF